MGTWESLALALSIMFAVILLTGFAMWLGQKILKWND